MEECEVEGGVAPCLAALGLLVSSSMWHTLGAESDCEVKKLQGGRIHIPFLRETKCELTLTR